MAFKLEAQTVITSATLELSAKALVELGDAAVHLQAVCEAYMAGEETLNPGERPEAVQALDVVMSFLNACASLADQTGVIKPKRVMPPRKKAAKK